MGNSTGELTHGFHLLRLEERCLRLLARTDLRPEAIVGRRQFLRSLGYHAFELYPALGQHVGSGAQRITDLIQFPHPADQWTNRLAAPQSFGSSRQCLDRPPYRPGHPPSEGKAED